MGRTFNSQSLQILTINYEGKYMFFGVISGKPLTCFKSLDEYKELYYKFSQDISFDDFIKPRITLKKAIEIFNKEQNKNFTKEEFLHTFGFYMDKIICSCYNCSAIMELNTIYNKWADQEVDCYTCINCGENIFSTEQLEAIEEIRKKKAVNNG